MLKTSMVHDTRWVARSRVTVAFPKAPVNTPGAGVSWFPDSDAVRRTVCAPAVPTVPAKMAAKAIKTTRRITDSFSPTHVTDKTARRPTSRIRSTPRNDRFEPGSEGKRRGSVQLDGYEE
jgi:hypothetical protein